MKKGIKAGAAGGAVLGIALAWANCFEHYSNIETQTALDYKETAKAINYDPLQGPKVKITSSTAEPSVVAPGSRVNFTCQYVVMTPTEKKEVAVNETRLLKCIDPQTKQYDSPNPVSTPLTIQQGETRNCGADCGWSIPPEMSKMGDTKCTMVFTVTGEGKTDAVSIDFIVTNDSELLAKAGTISKGKPIVFASSKSYASGGKTIGEGKTVTITDVKATFRKYPDKKAESFGVAKTGDVLPFVKEDTVAGKKWYQIRMENGETAWIVANTSKLSDESASSSDGKMTEGKTVIIKVGTATLRKYPDTKSDALATAKKGDSFPLVKQDTSAGKEWYEVKLANGETAWILASTAKISEE